MLFFLAATQDCGGGLFGCCFLFFCLIGWPSRCDLIDSSNLLDSALGTWKQNSDNHWQEHLMF